MAEAHFAAILIGGMPGERFYERFYSYERHSAATNIDRRRSVLAGFRAA